MFGGVPQMPAPAAPPPPPASPEPVDPAVQQARKDAQKRAAAMAGYGSLIQTGGLGVSGPGPNTTGKTVLGA